VSGASHAAHLSNGQLTADVTTDLPALITTLKAGSFVDTITTLAPTYETLVADALKATRRQPARGRASQ
jgi:hypothetical protein